MTGRRYNVLFLCTGNSARSIMAEALLNNVSAGRFHAYSAGSHPARNVNPFAIEVLRQAGLATEGLRSKSWEEFAIPGAPSMDFIFTVCDNAAEEPCPIWPGKPTTAHWGVADPAAVEGSDETKRVAFRQTARILQRRVELLASLPLEKFDLKSIQSKLREIGRK
jgi:arsenate reductase (thioredoxin)